MWRGYSWSQYFFCILLLESLILIFGYLILVPPPCSRRECKMMKNIGWLATEYWISSFPCPVWRKNAPTNSGGRPLLVCLALFFFLLFSFWSGWSGYIILYVHSKSHINDYFVNARQIKTNIHVFFFLAWFFTSCSFTYSEEERW